MLVVGIQILIVLLLAVLVYQDFKFRAISWIPLPILFVGFFILAEQGNTLAEISRFFLCNLLFVFLQLAALFVFFFIKEKRIFNIINTYHGLGDVLFTIVLCMAFSTVNFIHFYLCSLIIAIIGYKMFMFLRPVAREGVPTAGIIALTLAVLILVKYLIPGIDFYRDRFIAGIF